MRWRAAVAAVLLSGCASTSGYQRFAGPHGQRMARVLCHGDLFGQTRCYDLAHEACAGGSFDVLVNDSAGGASAGEQKASASAPTDRVDPLGARSTMLLVPSAPNSYVVMCVDGEGNAVPSKKAAAEQH